MAYTCFVCEKKPMFGNNVSHANNRTHRRWLPNLQKIQIYVGKAVKSVRMCTRCIRTGHFRKAV